MRVFLFVAYFLVLMSLIFLPLNGLLYVTAGVPILGLIGTTVLLIAWGWVSSDIAYKVVYR